MINTSEVGKKRLYRLIAREAPNYRDSDTAFSNPLFHELLEACFSRRGARSYTVHDVAFVDCMCMAHLTQVNLQGMKLPKLTKQYNDFVGFARANLGEHTGLQLGSEEESTITVVDRPRTPKRSIGCDACA